MFKKRRYGLLLVLLIVVSGCKDIPVTDGDLSNNGIGIDQRLQQLAAKAGAEPLKPVDKPPAAKAELGRMLYHDKLLSGTKGVSCATCHHLKHQTSDGQPLSIGVGGQGEGPDRIMADANARNPRNATIVINRGLPEYHAILSDSRIAQTDTGIVSPLGEEIPEGLENMLAIQALTPVVDRDEMLGAQGSVDVFGEKNEVAAVDDDNKLEMWRRLMERLMDVPEYVRLFKKAYPDVPVKELTFAHVANALAAFQISELSFTDSAWDNYLAGNRSALSKKEKRGGLLFFGKAKCAQCHKGPLLSDQKHHNIAVPQLGPGKEEEAPLDLGRHNVTEQEKDRFKFRTPPLRNVAISGPWMHNGAYINLEDAIRHHLDPDSALQNYDVTQLPPDIQQTYLSSDEVQSDLLSTLDPRVSRPTRLSEKEIDKIKAFLNALTTPEARNLSAIIPESVPSGLPVED